MKKNILIYFGLALLLLISAITISNYETKGEKATKRLESILSSSLLNLWNDYDNIHKYSTNELSIESVREINKKLSSIEIYSNVIDEAVSQNLLNPIAKNLRNIVKDIENNYDKNGKFTLQDGENYRNVLAEVNNILQLISEIYYVSESTEGSKPTLKIKKFDELKKLNHRLITHTKKTR